MSLSKLETKKPLTDLEESDKVIFYIEVSPTTQPPENHRTEIEQALNGLLKQMYNLGVVKEYYFGEVLDIVLNTAKINERKPHK